MVLRVVEKERLPQIGRSDNKCAQQKTTQHQPSKSQSLLERSVRHLKPKIKRKLLNTQSAYRTVRNLRSTKQSPQKEDPEEVLGVHSLSFSRVPREISEPFRKRKITRNDKQSSFENKSGDTLQKFPASTKYEQASSVISRARRSMTNEKPKEIRKYNKGGRQKSSGTNLSTSSTLVLTPKQRNQSRSRALGLDSPLSLPGFYPPEQKAQGTPYTEQPMLEIQPEEQTRTEIDRPNLREHHMGNSEPFDFPPTSPAFQKSAIQQRIEKVKERIDARLNSYNVQSYDEPPPVYKGGMLRERDKKFIEEFEKSSKRQASKDAFNALLRDEETTSPTKPQQLGFTYAFPGSSDLIKDAHSVRLEAQDDLVDRRIWYSKCIELPPLEYTETEVAINRPPSFRVGVITLTANSVTMAISICIFDPFTKRNFKTEFPGYKTKAVFPQLTNFKTRSYELKKKWWQRQLKHLSTCISTKAGEYHDDLIIVIDEAKLPESESNAPTNEYLAKMQEQVSDLTNKIEDDRKKRSEESVYSY